VEAIAHLDKVHPDASVSTLVSRWNGSPLSPGWTLGVTGAKSKYNAGTVIVQLTGEDDQANTVYEVVPSGLTFPIGKPVYVSAEIHTPRVPTPGASQTGTVTFHLRELSDPAAVLQSVTVEHAVVSPPHSPGTRFLAGGRDQMDISGTVNSPACASPRAKFPAVRCFRIRPPRHHFLIGASPPRKERGLSPERAGCALLNRNPSGLIGGDGSHDRLLPRSSQFQRVPLPPLIVMPCDHIDIPTSRREFLGRAGGGFGALALAALMGQPGLLRAVSPGSGALQIPNVVAGAKNVIWLFMEGGPVIWISSIRSRSSTSSPGNRSPQLRKTGHRDGRGQFSAARLQANLGTARKVRPLDSPIGCPSTARSPMICA